MHALSRLLLLLPPSSVLLAAATAASPPSHAPAICKAVPGSSSWPPAQAWNQLNESTGGRLLRPPPPGAVCHAGQPTFNASACGAVNASWSTFDFHQSDPVSSMYNQYNNDSCLPDADYPCSDAGYPVFVVNATTADHVRPGLDFARKHNVRLIVKSSGHDIIGRSSAPNSLSIWTHHLKGEMVFHNGSFRPSRCGVEIPGDAVTVGAGTQMGELQEFLDQYGQVAVGGGGATVSVGGYLTGGGHSLLSSRYGLGTDQVLEMEVVTPRAEVLTVNECQNPDLFWAMRGGGGSTFGVMTSVTIATHPSPAIVGMVSYMVVPGADQAAVDAGLDLATYVLGLLPGLSEQGLSGYSFVVQLFSSPLDGGAANVSGIAVFVALQDTQDPGDMAQMWAPIWAHANATWPGVIIASSITPYASFWAWFQVNKDGSATGRDTYVGSRLLDGPALTANATATREAFRRFSSLSSIGTAYLVGGKGVRDARPRGGSNAVLPAWRKAYVHATNGVTFPPLDAAARVAALDALQSSVDALRELAPDSGAYMNEADPEEPDWQHAFWGAHYPRLAAIKRAVDPDDVLWCTPCVGNERWHEVGSGLCRVA